MERMSDMPVCRDARPDDVGPLLEMMEEFNRGERIEMRAPRTALERLLADGELGRVLVLDDGDALAGYAVLTWGYDLEFGGRDAFLTELYVRPERRRRGWGRLILDTLSKLARECGAGAIHLGVYPDNEPALKLYRAAGYSRIPRDFYSKILN